MAWMLDNKRLEAREKRESIRKQVEEFDFDKEFNSIEFPPDFILSGWNIRHRMWLKDKEKEAKAAEESKESNTNN